MKKKILLNSILNDKVHGSSEILKRFLDYLEENSRNLSGLKSALPLVKKKLSHFPAILDLVNQLKIPLKKNNTKELTALIKFFKANDADINTRIFKNAEKELCKYNTVLTISHSRTLIEIFKLLKKVNPKLKVFVCESRPLNEGEILVKELKQNKINNQIIAEASAGKIIKQIDIVVLGADQLLKNGSIINKTGSRMLAVLAAYEGIPVYVLAGKSKFISKQTSKLPEEFEEVESKLITKIFTD
ncbi:MAG: hypothetical protein ROY99_09890 [Ignavibacterium sp.]|jgi:translation initiation factor eIF-2B subunit delta|nr:hypothetical protein [Ignavibacterium sp.]